jgi:sorbitol-specific phosphotransferase system component IIC
VIFRLLCLLFVFFVCLPMEAQSLNDVNVDKFKKAFNDASSTVRLVALLSPT